MDKLEELRVFVRIVERLSFTQAADDLQLPRATVTNAIQQLENRLGTRLLERTTRRVSVTLDGENYYQRCLRLLADMEEAEDSFRDTTPKGLLRINLQGTLARTFVIPALPAFLKRYPGIELHIGEGDKLVDLVYEGVDCVLRVGTLHDSSMVARRVANLEQITCASPGYLAQFGIPTDLKMLAQHRAVNYLSTATGRAMPFEFVVNGKKQTLNLPSIVSVSGADAYTASAIAGLGLVQVPRYHVQSQLEDGSLKLVLPKMPPPSLPVSVLYPQSRQVSARVRVFADWLLGLFASRVSRARQTASSSP